jgi:hypothetical protein
MLSTDRDEFVKLLKVLFAGLDKPLGETKEVAFWKALERMSMSDFSRCCDQILEDLEDGDRRAEWAKRFTPGDIWAAKRRLRSRSSGNQQPEFVEKPWRGDSWDMRANRLLLGYIGDQARAGVSYCSQHDRGFHLTPEWQPLSETVALTQPLVDYKNAWAQDMREAADPSNCVPIDQQMAAWNDCMRRANAEVELIRQRSAR